VVYGSPAYPVYERGGRFAGAAAIGIPLSGDFVLRAADIPEEVWERARIVWVCSPHNPTGSITAAADLRSMIEACRDRGVLLASDECYVDLYEDDPPPSALQQAGPEFAGILAYFSLSKRSGMTGYRSGAVVGDATAIAALKSLRGSIGVAPAEFVQAAAIAAWDDDAHAAERREIFARKRAVLRSAFEAAGYEVVGSRAAIYLWVRVGGDDRGFARYLLGEGVVVSPGRTFGPGGEGFVRLALVPTLEECSEAVEVLRRCLTQI
jgi:aspartate/methionine/tyrosine aminotransferase